ncbi:lipase family protein [Nocardia tengchongensis]|uniref:lipase family protein n=1 Tax=Nocardia tengchongensis TaxID=2055889 RepID=UPI003649C431
MIHTLRLLAATAVACGTLAAAATPATAAPPAPLPDGFYAAPATIGQLTPGTVLQTRTRPAPFAVAATVSQLEFVSTDSHDRPIAAVTTVLTPLGHRPGTPTKTIVYAHAINSLGLQCAPSQAMWDAGPDGMREAPLLNLLLLQGWTVILPDHLGPRSAYGAAKLGGKILLDAARAARNATPNDIGPLVMAGYSGGAMAAAFAAALAPTYAPDLPLTAAAIGGTPADLQTMADVLGHNAHPAFGIAAAVAAGLEREYPDELPISDYLNSEGHRFWNTISNACVNTILAAGAGRSVDQLGNNFDLYFRPETRTLLAENSIRWFPGAPSVPVFEFHSRTDPLIPVDAIDATVAAWRDRGTPVTQYILDIPEHMTMAVAGMPAAVDWLNDRVNETH